MRVARRIGVLSTILAGTLAVCAFSQTPGGSRSTPSAKPAITRTVLQTLDIPGSNYQVIQAKVQIPPHTSVPKHTHPGAVSGYILEGDYSIRLDGQPVKNVAPGESFVIPSGVAHEEMTGARAATIIAVFAVEKGKPLTSPSP
ncbi:MAG TPA: cupin domain-containing protein [Steroidobacteraceae bacterium]|jgi:quercetin dioxygenase-like cupin family protein